MPQRSHARAGAADGRNERGLPVPVGQRKQPCVESPCVPHLAAIKPHLEEETVNAWLHSAQIRRRGHPGVTACLFLARPGYRPATTVLKINFLETTTLRRRIVLAV